MIWAHFQGTCMHASFNAHLMFSADDCDKFLPLYAAVALSLSASLCASQHIVHTSTDVMPHHHTKRLSLSLLSHPTYVKTCIVETSLHCMLFVLHLWPLVDPGCPIQAIGPRPPRRAWSGPVCNGYQCSAPASCWKKVIGVAKRLQPLSYGCTNRV